MLRRKFLLGLAMSALCAVPAFAQGGAKPASLSVDDIIAKNIEAHGGLAKMQAIKTVKMTGKVIVQGGAMELPMTLQTKRPNMIRMEASFQGKALVQAYDGTTAWMVMPLMGKPDPEVMPADQAKDVIDQADIDGPLVDYKGKGHKVELVGKEDIEGTDTYKLKVTLKSGDVSYMYIDAGSFLEVKTTSKQKQQGTEVESDTFYSDFKDVNGVLFPFAIETRIGGKPVSQIVVEKIEPGIAVEDGFFKMPAKSPEKKDDVKKP